MLMICRICTNIESNKAFEIKEMMFGLREKFAYFQCGNCECLQICEIPKDMTKYYPANYYSFEEKLPTLRQRKNALIEHVRKQRDDYIIYHRSIIGRLINLIYPASDFEGTMALRFSSHRTKGLLKRNSRILDVGCGSGKLLLFLKDAGFHNVLGVDPFVSKDIKYPNEVSILKSTIHELSGEFDLIMFHHSFEHIADPVETIQSAARLLSAEGVCFIRIPTVSSFAWEKYRENWLQLDAPRHFFLHSLKSMQILAEKSNLKLTKVVYDSNEFQFIGSERYIRDTPLISQDSKLQFTKQEVRHYKKLAKMLNRENRGDQAGFYFQRQQT